MVGSLSLMNGEHSVATGRLRLDEGTRVRVIGSQVRVIGSQVRVIGSRSGVIGSRSLLDG